MLSLEDVDELAQAEVAFAVLCSFEASTNVRLRNSHGHLVCCALHWRANMPSDDRAVHKTIIAESVFVVNGPAGFSACRMRFLQLVCSMLSFIDSAAELLRLQPSSSLSTCAAWKQLDSAQDGGICHGSNWHLRPQVSHHLSCFSEEQRPGAELVLV